ncbi:MAG: response regulator transcription factor [Bacteroidaceae bacterium]|nr:response regulator transcription factor [Bacteroidaceae bacterium]
MTIVIFEDEIFNYHLMCDMLQKILPSCNILEPISTVAEGRKFFADGKVRPDIIIADIQLNDGLSFSALVDAPADIPIIFTTAYDEYALRAFEFNSLSYLLKPVDTDSLQKAINKALSRLITDEERKELLRLMSQHSQYRERFLLHTSTGEMVVPLSLVRYIMTMNKSSFIVLHNGTMYNTDLSLTDIDSQLDPTRFMRVNRQFIIPASEVVGFERDTNGKERMIIKGDDVPEIIISRDKRNAVHEWVLKA